MNEGHTNDDGTQIWRDDIDCGTKIFIPDSVFHRAGALEPRSPLFQLPSSIHNSAIFAALEVARDATCPPMVREAREQRRRNYLRRFPYLKAFIQ
jgi:hypothetical protein